MDSYLIELNTGVKYRINILEKPVFPWTRTGIDLVAQYATIDEINKFKGDCYYYDKIKYNLFCNELNEPFIDEYNLFIYFKAKKTPIVKMELNKHLTIEEEKIDKCFLPSTYNSKWIEIKTGEHRTFQFADNPELIHIIKTGFPDIYIVVYEDAFEINLGKTFIGAKNEVEKKFEIIL